VTDLVACVIRPPEKYVCSLGWLINGLIVDSSTVLDICEVFSLVLSWTVCINFVVLLERSAMFVSNVA
jgi:hypothetical protein